MKKVRILTRFRKSNPVLIEQVTNMKGIASRVTPIEGTPYDFKVVRCTYWRIEVYLMEGDTIIDKGIMIFDLVDILPLDIDRLMFELGISQFEFQIMMDKVELMMVDDSFLTPYYFSIVSKYTPDGCADNLHWIANKLWEERVGL